MVLWDTSPPSSQFAGFLNKVAIPCPNNSSLYFIGLSCGKQYELGLGNIDSSPKRPEAVTDKQTFPVEASIAWNLLHTWKSVISQYSCQPRRDLTSLGFPRLGLRRGFDWAAFLL